MIRINLIPQKRTRRVDKGLQTLLVGVGTIVAGLVAVIVFVAGPIKEKNERLEATVANLTRENNAKQKQLKGHKELKEAVKAAEERNKVVLRLNKARATPAHMMRELSNILTSKRTPTMTNAMSAEIDANPNRKLSQEWDAKHVWITEFREKGGEFTLRGGAQSDGDMTQLALRMQASVHFQNVVPQGGTEAVDKDSGITYYKFTIVGKVAY